MAMVPLLDDQGNRILDDQGNAILVDNGLPEDSGTSPFWQMQLIHVPWGAEQGDTPPDPDPPATQNRWVWADGDTHTWANGEVAGFNEEP